jgi:hypothetical protein
MVSLVKKISANPLGVEYNMLSAEAMREGMETAFLLQTINKIGSLMRIGFGEAGAVVIAKNLAGGGTKLNLRLLSFQSFRLWSERHPVRKMHECD